eukprot:10499027-Prorocentrum_lima.AAC.1
MQSVTQVEWPNRQHPRTQVEWPTGQHPGSKFWRIPLTGRQNWPTILKHAGFERGAHRTLHYFFNLLS